jgi:ribonuclease D
VKDVKTLKPRSRGVAQAVAEWRELRARRLDVPVRQVLADLALLGIAQRAPRSIDELAQSRGVDGRYTKGQIAQEILEAVERGRHLDIDMPKVDIEEFDRDLRPAATLMSAWVSEVAGRSRLETALLATRADIIDYLRGSPSARVRHGWRADILGRDLEDLVTGQAGIAFDGEGGLRLIRHAD